MGVGICEGRCEAPLPFRAKLGAPLREDIVHLDMLYAVADCPRWENDTLVRSKTLGRITARELGRKKRRKRSECY